ncbi:nudix-type nucleoside diphosphatase (YffH/AdpP family) [Rubricella aquisinus]|uniref:ADP-ribose pyrophosphatase n=1 Tax=Rubricella aquisinus TaxID=2028108 RepID=A0A840WYC4_9RHOB|nr:NUDIX domain-containing protein [Rubricella aquisinus]MBB5516160.1 nudix-type nucleoside diphosphatase (YffH/AdpP family) [Rubricella aquisinus]
MTADAMFFFGTLRDPLTRDAVIGPEAAGLSIRAAVIADARAHGVKGQDFPILIAEDGAQADGILVTGITAEARARLAFFEGEFGYTLEPRQVTADGQTHEVEVFIADPAAFETDGPWDFARWQADQRAGFVRSAAELMRHYGTRPATDAPVLWNGIRARQFSATRAADQQRPAQHRSPFGRADVRVSRHAQPYAHFFSIEDHTLSHRLHNGGWSAPLERAVLASADAVTVLPWDPVTDRVLLIEQFRPAPFVRGDQSPWLLEPVAGRMDGLESPEDCARREAREEAGITLTALEKVNSHYPSPGTVTEYVTCYIGRADLARAGGVHGVETEHEDIRSHLLTLAEAEAAVASGEIAVGPLIVSLYYLRLHHARLRAAWG